MTIKPQHDPRAILSHALAGYEIDKADFELAVREIDAAIAVARREKRERADNIEHALRAASGIDIVSAYLMSVGAPYEEEIACDDARLVDEIDAAIAAARREERERWRRIIEHAPHARLCPMASSAGFAQPKCVCWKADALRALGDDA